jgi:cytidyltransferase-like protein
MTKVIVFGAFDPLHEGHKDLFKQAKALGDYLIVAASSDENIRREKARDPRIVESSRIKEIQKNLDVNEVVVGDRENEYTILEKFEPDVIALGYDQKIPEGLKNQVKKYKIITLKPYKPEIYKSSKIFRG